MRTTLIALLVLIIAIGAYCYEKNPKDSLGAARELFSYRTLAKYIPGLAPPTGDDAVSPDGTPVWTPPALLPVQPNWTWTTTDGKVYHNVKIVRMDADSVTITHADGGGRVPISTLPSDMQTYFNYNPAAAAAAKRDFDRRHTRHSQGAVQATP